MTTPRGLYILVVAGDPDIVQQLQRAAQQSGYAVKLCFVGDALEAHQFLRRQGERFQRAPRPDLILLDIPMPGQEGLAFLGTLKQDEHLCAIPLVVMSASALEADVHAAYQLGAAGYLLKPADANDLASAVNKFCQYWCGQMRLPENFETNTGPSGSQAYNE